MKVFRFNVNDLKTIYLPLPILSEQQSIANYLDEKTSKIDQLISNKREQIEKLKEIRKIEIFTAVTKGLDPNVKLKPSGIEWLGDIPIHWEVSRIKDVSDIHGGNGFPDNLQGFEEGDLPFLKVSDINGKDRQVSIANNYVTNDVISDKGWNIVPENSILTAKIGAALSKNHRKINEIECIIDNNMIAIKNNKRISSLYLYYISKIIDFDWFNNPGAIPSLSMRHFLPFHICLPNEHEQTSIANYLDEKTSKIDQLVNNLENQIEQLEEVRKIEIYNAVTGKIKIA